MSRMAARRGFPSTAVSSSSSGSSSSFTIRLKKLVGGSCMSSPTTMSWSQRAIAPKRILRAHLACFVDHQQVELHAPRRQELRDRQGAHQEHRLEALDRLAGLLHQLADGFQPAGLLGLFDHDPDGPSRSGRMLVDVGPRDLVGCDPDPVAVRAPEAIHGLRQLVTEQPLNLRIGRLHTRPHCFVDGQQQNANDALADNSAVEDLPRKVGGARLFEPSQIVSDRRPLDDQVEVLAPAPRHPGQVRQGPMGIRLAIERHGAVELKLDREALEQIVCGL